MDSCARPPPRRTPGPNEMVSQARWRRLPDKTNLLMVKRRTSQPMPGRDGGLPGRHLAGPRVSNRANDHVLDQRSRIVPFSRDALDRWMDQDRGHGSPSARPSACQTGRPCSSNDHRFVMLPPERGSNSRSDDGKKRARSRQVTVSDDNIKLDTRRVLRQRSGDGR